MIEDKELYTDAMRYRALRKIATDHGALEDAVAINQLDYCSMDDEFDITIDEIIKARLGTSND